MKPGSVNLGETCLIVPHPKGFAASLPGWVPALLPAVLVVALGKTLPAWMWMWAIALALFIGAKWLTILRCLGFPFATKRLLAYVFLWPGMDVRSFCGNGPVARPAPREWGLAAAKAPGSEWAVPELALAAAKLPEAAAKARAPAVGLEAGQVGPGLGQVGPAPGPEVPESAQGAPQPRAAAPAVAASTTSPWGPAARTDLEVVEAAVAA